MREAFPFQVVRVARHLYRTLAGANCDTATELRRFGTHEPFSSRILASSVGPGDYCLDIGSQVGWFAAIMREAGAAVVTVEPNPEMEADIRCAVGAVEGQGSLLLSKRSNWHSLLVPDSWTGQAATVPVRTLDGIIAETGPPTFLKLDIEGGEWDALSASRYVQEERPSMMLELHPNLLGRGRAGMLVGMLQGLGYACVAVDRMWDFEVFRRLGVFPLHFDGWDFVVKAVELRQPVVLHLRRGPA